MRLSRGRSTPTRRAMGGLSGFDSGVGRDASSSASDDAPATAPEVFRRLRRLAITWWVLSCVGPDCRLTGFRRARSGLASSAGGLAQSAAETPRAPSSRVASALPLLVAGVLADHHDAAVATDHLALVTDLLDARVDLHGWRSSQIGWLLVAVDDPATGQVVGGQLHHHAVLGEDPDVVLAHLAADVGEDLVPVAELHSEHRVGEGLHDGALVLDHAFFLRHVLRNLSLIGCLPAGPGTAPVRSGWTSCGCCALLIRGARRSLEDSERSEALGQPRGTTKHDPRWADTPV